MKKVLLMTILLMLVSLTACSNTMVSKQDETNYKQLYEEARKAQAPLIKSITLQELDGEIIKEDAGWYALKKQVKIAIHLEGDCQEIDLFMTPSGSATHKEQKLIGEISPNHNVAEYIWDVPDDTHGHFNIIAYNKDVGRRSGFYNVYLAK